MKTYVVVYYRATTTRIVRISERMSRGDAVTEAETFNRTNPDYTWNALDAIPVSHDEAGKVGERLK